MRSAILCFLLFGVSLVAAQDAPSPKVDQLDIKASFIVSMIADNEGGAFVGTEDHGVYHCDNFGNVNRGWWRWTIELSDPHRLANHYR